MFCFIRKGKTRRPPTGQPVPLTEQGFTMLEVLMTMLILTIVLLGLAALQVATIRQVTLARNANTGLRLGQSIIEKYRRLAFIDLPGTTSPDWEPVFKRDGVSKMENVGADGEKSGPFTVTSFMEVAGNGDRLITVRVTWIDLMPGTDPDPNKTHRVLETMLTLRRADL